MKPINVVLPFFPPPAERPRLHEALQRTVRALESAGGHVVTVVAERGTSLALPSGVKTIWCENGGSSETPLPPGWLEALRRYDGGGDVVLLDCRCSGAVEETVAAAAQALRESSRNVAFGLSEAIDHPCQCNHLCDVLASHPYSAVEPDPEMIEPAWRGLFSASGEVVLSKPFAFPFTEWAPEPEAYPAFYEVLPDFRTLRPLNMATMKAPLPDSRVVLVRENASVARQLCVGDAATAAVPLLVSTSEMGISLRSKGVEWEVSADGDFVQLFPLDRRAGERDTNASMLLHKLESAADGSQKVCVPPFEGPFLMNLYRNAVLPSVDIELPYVASEMPWEITLKGLERYHRGELISGRQAFPEVLEFSGMVAAFSAAAAKDPFLAISNQDFIGFDLHDDMEGDETWPAGFDPLETGAEWAVTPLMQVLGKRWPDRFKNAFRVHAAKSVFKACRANKVSLPIKAFEIFEHNLAQVHDTRANEMDPPGKQSKTIPFSEGWTLDQARLWHGKNDLEATTELLDRIYARHAGIGGVYAAVALEKYMPRERYDLAAALFQREMERGWLPPAQMLRFAEALAGCGRFEEAESIVARAYKADATLRNGYAQIAWYGCYLMDFDPQRALALLDADEAQGRLGLDQVSKRGAYLAATGDLDAGLAVVQQAYDTHGAVFSGGFARVGWEYHVGLRRNPVDALPYFEMDEKYVRGNFMMQKLSIQAYTGDLASVERRIASLYARGVKMYASYSRCALMHWIKNRDDMTLLRMMLRDHEYDFLLMHNKFLLYNLLSKYEYPCDGLDKALFHELQGGFDMAEKRCVQWFRFSGCAASASVVRNLAEHSPRKLGLL